MFYEMTLTLITFTEGSEDIFFIYDVFWVCLWYIAQFIFI